MNAKKWLGSKLYPDALFQKRTGLKAPLSHLGDILDFIKKGNTDDFDIPVFCILSPSEVPLIPAKAYSALFSGVNELRIQLKTISNQFEAFSNHFPPLPQPGASASKPADNHSTIVVSKLPPSIRDPTSRKDFIDQLSGHDSVRLFVNIEKSVASDFCESVKSVVSGIGTKILQKRYLGIIKGIPLSLNASEFKMHSGVVNANRIGFSQTIKLDFLDSFAKRDAMKNGVKIGYKIFRIYDFVSVPRCCFKCRSPDHFINDCTSQVEKCARCAEYHIFSEDAPCTNRPKCANCGDSHTSYSLLCPVLKSRIATAVKK